MCGHASADAPQKWWNVGGVERTIDFEHGRMRLKQRQLTDDEYSDVVRQQVKMRRDAASEYDRAGRTQQAEQERAELAVLQGYLPAQLDADTVREVVQGVIRETGASGPGDLGKVMSGAMRLLKGRADGTEIQAMARQLLIDGSS